MWMSQCTAISDTVPPDDVPFVLVPCYDSSDNAPPDAALNVGNEEKAKLLANAYVSKGIGAQGCRIGWG